MDAFALMNDAVVAARLGGFTVDGYYITRSEDGFAAWLYYNDEDDNEVSLFEIIDTCENPEDAAVNAQKNVIELIARER